MAWSMHAFSSAMALTVAPLLIPVVPDQSITTNANGLIVGKNNVLLGGAAVLGAAVANNYVRFLSPSLRRVTPQMLTPINTGLFAPDPVRHDIDNYQTRQLEIGEELDVEAGGAIVAIGQKAVIVCLADSEVKEIYGQIIQARAQITIAQAVNAWTIGQMVFMDRLPVGTYSMVGAECVMPGAIAIRFIFVGSSDRPGILPIQLPTTGDNYRLFRRGRMGEFGRFTEFQIPQVECIGSVAAGSATYEAVIDLMVVK